MATTALPRGMIKRGDSYCANFRVNGRRVRKSLSRNLRSATTMLIEFHSRIERHPLQTRVRLSAEKPPIVSRSCLGELPGKPM